jgi:hypothetical protein
LETLSPSGIEIELQPASAAAEMTANGEKARANRPEYDLFFLLILTETEPG